MQLKLSEGGLQQVDRLLLKRLTRSYFTERFTGYARYFDGKIVGLLGIPQMCCLSFVCLWGEGDLESLTVLLK